MNIQLFHFSLLLFVPLFAYTQNTEPDVFYKEGSRQKISQLVGDYDKHFEEATDNLTNTNYSLWGTDLGIPFQHNGKTYILFGDVPGTDRDPIAYTEDTNPENGIDLTFITNSDGTYRPIEIPGISQGAFEVPSEGISIDDKMYIFHTTDDMARSVVAKSEDDGKSFSLVNDNFSTNHFINVSIVMADPANWPNLPAQTETGLLIFGSGKYRDSNIHLAFQAASEIENENSILYLSGWDTAQNPIWSDEETAAIELFNQNCVGEFSVIYNTFIEKWIVLYNCDKSPHPRGILFRTADKPWGPWSEEQVLFEPWEDDGYCHFIHVSWQFNNCDQVYDPGRAYEWGGEYGPYIFEDLTTGTDSTTTLYYTMSTWNPYTVVLMKSQLIKPIKTGIEDPQKQAYFSVYPNPAKASITIDFNAQINPKLLIITDALGKIILKRHLLKEDLRIDMTNWDNGLYFIKTINESGLGYSEKIIKY